MSNMNGPLCRVSSADSHPTPLLHALFPQPRRQLQTLLEDMLECHRLPTRGVYRWRGDELSGSILGDGIEEEAPKCFWALNTGKDRQQ